MQSNPRAKLPQGFSGNFPPAQQGQHNPGMLSPTGFSNIIGPTQPTDSQQQTDNTKQSEVNTARLCRIGQELVHEIIQKATDIFQVLKTTQLPNANPQSLPQYAERQKHIQDTMKMIMTYFKQLKQVYLTVNENCSKMDLKPVQELIPIIGEENDMDTNKEESESYKIITQEHLALTEQLKSRNVHLKELIDQLRCLLWEINTMMAMKNNKP